VQHNETGLVVNRSNPQSLSEAIAGLYHDRQQLRQLSVAAKARFDSHFKIDDVADDTISLYQSILTKK
jgi:glycosyltransferase involved in cell wall biosynthesis